MELHHRGTETQSFIMHKNGPTRPWAMWEKTSQICATT